MTRIEELEQKLNECQKALAEIQKEITELNELQIELKENKKEGKWKPAYKEKYWIRDDGGEIAFDNWDRHEIDIWRYNNLPIFPTKEECEKYWYFMDTVKEKSYEFTADEWRNWDIEKYDILYDFVCKCLKVTVVRTNKYLGEIYFRTREDAQYIIDNFKDELMEYFV